MNTSVSCNSLDYFCSLPESTLRTELTRCCGSPGWVSAMLHLLPFRSVDSLLQTATTTWWNLPTTEWKAAFLAHPQIG